VGTSTSIRRASRLQVRFGPEDMERLRAHAHELCLPLAATVRALTRFSLAERRDERMAELESVAVAALMASEQALRLLELVLPAGARRAAQVAEASRLSALERVARVRAELAEAEG